MEAWYRDLISDPVNAIDCLAYDYEPHARLFKQLHGTILDIGGGVGIVRHYLHREAEYLVIDPSLHWLGSEWKRLAPRFVALADPPTFLRGIGEYLPFQNGVFDAALSLWSLNHAADPQAVINEAHRVLRPGGYLLLILEDMELTWRDLAACFAYQRLRWSGLATGVRGVEVALERSGFTIAKAIAHKRHRHPWPLQTDHLRILERDLQSWLRGRFQIIERSWEGGYLRYQARRA